MNEYIENKYTITKIYKLKKDKGFDETFPLDLFVKSTENLTNFEIISVTGFYMIIARSLNSPTNPTNPTSNREIKISFINSHNGIILPIGCHGMCEFNMRFPEIGDILYFTCNIKENLKIPKFLVNCPNKRLVPEALYCNYSDKIETIYTLNGDYEDIMKCEFPYVILCVFFIA